MDIEAAEDKHLGKILQFLDDHWDQAGSISKILRPTGNLSIMGESDSEQPL